MSHLLILNYSMDENSPALAHQIEVSRKLSEHFDRVTVLTGSKGAGILPPNIEVVSSEWLPGHHCRNIHRFLRVAFRIIQRNKPDIIFSHMTHIQSAFLLPFSRYKKIPHFLWYAHASSSLALKWDYLLVDKILTSTKGSFPFSGKKIICIGQAVNHKMFFQTTRKNPPQKFLHYGRFDVSKRIDLIIESTESIRETNPEISLTICGNSSNARSTIHANRIIARNQKNVEAGWLTFQQAIPRKNIPGWLKNFDVLVHAFKGSLDKVLVESLMAGLSVVSINAEFVSEFGLWGTYVDGEEITLKSELRAMMNYDENKRTEFNLLRQELALNSHTEIKWIENVHNVLISAI